MAGYIAIQEITFPELRKLKGKYTLTDTALGKIIGNTSKTFRAKLDNKAQFSRTDMLKLHSFFTELGEAISLYTLFFDWDYSIK